jgi:hypothetical protein
MPHASDVQADAVPFGDHLARWNQADVVRNNVQTINGAFASA